MLFWRHVSIGTSLFKVVRCRLHLADTISKSIIYMMLMGNTMDTINSDSDVEKLACKLPP